MIAKSRPSASLPNQLTFADPLELTLRQAYEKFHRRHSHKESYIKAALTALDHWERCTPNPPIGQCGNHVMQEFANVFLRSPLPSKVATLLRRARKGQREALAMLQSIGCPWSSLQPLDSSEAFSRVAAAPSLPQALLPTAVTFNAQRRTLEAIFSTLGPKHRGNRYAQGLLPEVPCCRPEDEEEPEVIYATEEHLNAIYKHCDVASWPAAKSSGVHPPDLWRAFFVYLYNVGSRRGDFLRLTKSQVKLAEGIILTRQKKSGKFRAVPINVTLVRHLRTIWHSRGELMFPFPRNKRDLYATWYRIQEAAGIHVERLQERTREPYYGFHELRKTSLGEYFAVNEHAAQEMGAHSALMTTLKHYVPAVKREGKLRKAVDALPQPAAFAEQAPPPQSPPPQPPRLRVVG